MMRIETGERHPRWSLVVESSLILTLLAACRGQIKATTNPTTLPITPSITQPIRPTELPSATATITLIPTETLTPTETQIPIPEYYHDIAHSMDEAPEGSYADVPAIVKDMMNHQVLTNPHDIVMHPDKGEPYKMKLVNLWNRFGHIGVGIYCEMGNNYDPRGTLRIPNQKNVVDDVLTFWEIRNPGDTQSKIAVGLIADSMYYSKEDAVFYINHFLAGFNERDNFNGAKFLLSIVVKWDDVITICNPALYDLFTPRKDSQKGNDEQKQEIKTMLKTLQLPDNLWTITAWIERII